MIELTPIGPFASFIMKIHFLLGIFIGSVFNNVYPESRIFNSSQNPF